MPVHTSGRLAAGKRQELEAWLADSHCDRERFDGHLGDVFPSKAVGIFTVVMVITAAFSSATEEVLTNTNKVPENERWAELFEKELGRL